MGMITIRTRVSTDQHSYEDYNIRDDCKFEPQWPAMSIVPDIPFTFKPVIA